MKFLAFLALWLVVLAVPAGTDRARAEDSVEYGATASGLCGLVYTGAPSCGRGATLSASAGYGATFMQGRHDRALGGLGVALVPVRYLALSLAFAGRVDAHPRDALGKSVSATGQPFLRARVGAPLGKSGFSLGGELGLWIPGADAPSLELRATTPDLKLLFGLRRARWQALGLFGARIDQSYRSAPDLTRVRAVDRVTLGLSDAHALLVGLGVGYLVSAPLTLFAELSADVLLGQRAPAFLESPIRIAAGARYFVLPQLQLELTLTSSLSQRPSIAVSDPLVPIEPRVSVVFGLRTTFGVPKTAPEKPRAKDPLPAPAELPPSGSIRGVLHDAAGAPLPDVPVKLLAAEGLFETITDAQGRYSFEQLRAGKAELSADAPGFKSARWEAVITQERTELPVRAMEAGESTGILRCLVRSFESHALRAQVNVRDARGKRVAGGETDDGGSLELSLPPGQYRVMIEAAGFRSQLSQVQVAANEVAILNVDMRKIE